MTVNPRIISAIFIYLVCAAVFAAIVYYTVSVSNAPDYPSMIDTARSYEAQEVSAEMKNVGNACRIENFYTSGEYKVIRVISEHGYVDEVELLVLLQGTTVRAVKGINVKETADYGAKCFNDRFLSQFIGLDLANIEQLSGRQDNYEEGDILYVSHATTTSRAVIYAINAVSIFVKSI